jgi:hypothetical protein
MRRVLIESPYAGNVEQNVAYAHAALLDCLRRGEAPFASHLLYTQVLDDELLPERHLGMEAGFAWGEVAEATVVYQDLGISNGMARGIQRARDAGRPVEYRTLNDPNVPIGERQWKSEMNAPSESKSRARGNVVKADATAKQSITKRVQA